MTGPDPGAAWQARPTDQLASALLLLPAAVVAAESAWSYVVPGLEACLASTPGLPDQLRFHLRGAAAQKPGLEEVAVVAVVVAQVV